MEKLIAFNLYRQNEFGGHQTASDEPKQVYLASEVNALSEKCERLRKAFLSLSGGHTAVTGVAVIPHFHGLLQSDLDSPSS